MKHGLLNGNKKREGSDECYTLQKDVDLFMPDFMDKIKDKVVYSPCDSEKSAFVKWFKAHPDVCKEFIYTFDDFHNHADLFEKADVIVTNPPFSLWIDLWKNYIKDKDFILILGNTKIQTFVKNGVYPYVYKYNDSDHFITPAGDLKKVANNVYSTFEIALNSNMVNHKCSYTGKYNEVDCFYEDKKYKLKRYFYADLPLETDSLFILPVSYDTLYKKYFSTLRILISADDCYINGKPLFASFLATMDPNITLENYKEELKKYEQK